MFDVAAPSAAYACVCVCNVDCLSQTLLCSWDDDPVAHAAWLALLNKFSLSIAEPAHLTKIKDKAGRNTITLDNQQLAEIDKVLALCI